jgi:tRNA U34 2-thiouridine synthase MnmA/TrmU
MKKCIVLFSGGLDSRLAVKIMQKQGFEIICVFFKLPFGCGGEEKEIKDFCKKHGTKLKIFDCTKSKLLMDYLKTLKKPEFKTGAGVNPCIDCKIFMFKRAREFADKNKIDLIVSGEVLGERPMSQMPKSLMIIEEKSELSGRLLRPLSAKLFLKTNAEKKGIVNTNKLYDIKGRRRQEQINLAKKFKINYPQPAGGCILCEKALRKRFQTLFFRKLNDKEVKLISIGRHFILKNSWVILGRNEKENKIIEKIGKDYTLIIPEFTGPSAVIIDKAKKQVIQKVNELIKAYSKKGTLKNREEFEKYKI